MIRCFYQALSKYTQMVNFVIEKEHISLIFLTFTNYLWNILFWSLHSDARNWLAISSGFHLCTKWKNKKDHQRVSVVHDAQMSWTTPLFSSSLELHTQNILIAGFNLLSMCPLFNTQSKMYWYTKSKRMPFNFLFLTFNLHCIIFKLTCQTPLWSSTMMGTVLQCHFNKSYFRSLARWRWFSGTDELDPAIIQCLVHQIDEQRWITSVHWLNTKRNSSRWCQTITKQCCHVHLKVVQEWLIPS